MSARLGRIGTDPLYYLCMVAVLAACHLQIYAEQFGTVYLYPLAYLTILYVGYKFTRTAVAFAVLAVYLFFLTLKILQNESTDLTVLLFQTEVTLADGVTIEGQSIDNYIVLLLTGLAAVFCFDRLERYLADNGLSLEELSGRSHAFFIRLLYLNIRNVMAGAETGQREAKNRDASSSSASAGALSSLKALLNSTAVVAFLALTLIAALQFTMFFRIQSQTGAVMLLPAFTSVLLLILFAWFRGFRQVAWIVLILAAALVGMTLAIPYGLTETIGMDPIIRSPSILLAVLMSAWWINALKPVWLNENIKQSVAGAVQELRRLTQSPGGRISAGAVVLLLVTSLTFELSIWGAEETSFGSIRPVLIEEFVFSPVLLLFSMIFLLVERVRAETLSNVILVLGLILGLQELMFTALGSAETGLMLLWGFNSFNAIEIMALVLTPLLLTNYVPRSLAHYRACTFGLIGLLMLTQLLFHGSLQPGATLGVYNNGYFPSLITLIVQSIICEAAAQLLYRFHGRLMKQTMQEEA